MLWHEEAFFIIIPAGASRLLLFIERFRFKIDQPGPWPHGFPPIWAPFFRFIWRAELNFGHNGLCRARTSKHGFVPRLNVQNLFCAEAVARGRVLCRDPPPVSTNDFGPLGAQPRTNS